MIESKKKQTNQVARRVLNESEKKQMIQVARRMARRTMANEGGDSKNKEKFKAYWQENRKRFVTLSRIARKGYIPQ